MILFRPIDVDRDWIARDRPGQITKRPFHVVWLTDFTYIPSKEGFTYLCTVQDLCSRRIVGWATSRNIVTTLALDALNQAVALRNPPADSLFTAIVDLSSRAWPIKTA